MTAPEFLHRLLTATGPSGNETAAAQVWQDACGAFAPQIAASTEVSWSCLAEELPVTWSEARRRLAGHPIAV